MKKVFATIGFIVIIVIAFIVVKRFSVTKIISPLGTGGNIPIKTLAQYSFPSLHLSQFSDGSIVIDKVIKDNPVFASYLYYSYVNGKRVSGLMNVPKTAGQYPVIILIRGYVDKKGYVPGYGTLRDGEYLAQNGFITLAPDFLGYGFSDPAPKEPMEDRFLTYVTVMDLISSLKNLNRSLADKLLPVRFDGIHTGIWGHSNGGQIALSILEISGATFPTVLWAPVSKPFPYSILYYTDEVDDHGKALRQVVANFEKDYDSEKYSLTNYFSWIKAPLQLDQGTADEEVPQKWSDELADILEKKGIKIDYYTYPGEDHNFDRGSWTTVIERTLQFYKEQFKM